MKSLYIALLIVAAGAIIYLLLTRKPPVYLTGPTQTELDNFKAKATKEVDSLLTRLQAIRDTQRKDSVRYGMERVNSNRAISYWKKRASEAKESLSDTLPDSTIISEQAKIIVLQDSVIEKQAQRILTDSAYIQNLQSSFDRRLAIEHRQRQLLEDENKLQAKVIEDQGKEIDRRRKSGGIKSGVIGALVLAVLLL